MEIPLSLALNLGGLRRASSRGLLGVLRRIRRESCVPIRELFATLFSVHGLRVSHDDLEERNIVVSSDKSPRIIEFETSGRNHACTISKCYELFILADAQPSHPTTVLFFSCSTCRLLFNLPRFSLYLAPILRDVIEWAFPSFTAVVFASYFTVDSIKVGLGVRKSGDASREKDLRTTASISTRSPAD